MNRMNDLISRQAAIDAIRASTLKYTGFMEMEMYTDDDSVEAIKGVPPAQQWIPCSEGLPGKSGDYLVTVAHHSGELLVEVDQFDNENGSWWHYMDDVIAWMSRPEPYKGEEE